MHVQAVVECDATIHQAHATIALCDACQCHRDVTLANVRNEHVHPTDHPPTDSNSGEQVRRRGRCDDDDDRVRVRRRRRAGRRDETRARANGVCRRQPRCRRRTNRSVCGVESRSSWRGLVSHDVHVVKEGCLISGREAIALVTAMATVPHNTHPINHEHHDLALIHEPMLIHDAQHVPTKHDEYKLTRVHKSSPLPAFQTCLVVQRRRNRSKSSTA
mmetsp:Transcript_12694/g.21547  ORF Transcript_12694/g.21547 Transcript_12694/m.21547 type:complete len:217 (+) Transcript_12694:1207-1857(+)